MTETITPTAPRAPKRAPDLALILTILLLVGWIVSVGLRSFNRDKVEIVPEMMGAAMAIGVIYSKVSRRRDDSDKGDTP